MARSNSLLLCALAVACSPAPREPGEAAGEEPRRYAASFSEAPPVVDGRLDDPAWEEAPWTEDFADIRGAGHPVPRHRTRAKLVWDTGHLYVAAALDEPHLWATLTEHDAIVWRDHDFEVFLDPDGNGLDYYEIEVNALGTVLDLFLAVPYRDGGREDLGWTPAGLAVAVGVEGTLNDPRDEDVGWTAEMAIPWSELVPPGSGRTGSAPRSGEEWRVNFSRVQWPLEIVDGAYRKAVEATPDRPHPEDNWVWSPQGEIDMHVPGRWGYVRFDGPPFGDRP